MDNVIYSARIKLLPHYITGGNTRENSKIAIFISG